MTTRRRTLVSLTGGLGNQLFQLSAALSVAGVEGVSLVYSLARPRSDSAGKPDLHAFSLSNHSFESKEHEGSWFFRKVAGYSLRSGFEPRGIERLRGVRALITLLASLALSIYFKELCVVFRSSALGFDKSLSDSPRKRILIGYFQTYRYASSPPVFDELMALTLATPSPYVEEMRGYAEDENPIIIHARLTDYRTEGFGLLPADYYSSAIATIRKDGFAGKIWLFSDEPDEAIKLLPDHEQNQCRVINEPQGTSPAATLQVMRLGKAYVIANSTFSWWGAFLRYDQSAPVFYPDPWFLSSPEINELCPLEWRAISR